MGANLLQYKEGLVAFAATLEDPCDKAFVEKIGHGLVADADTPHYSIIGTCLENISKETLEALGSVLPSSVIDEAIRVHAGYRGMMNLTPSPQSVIDTLAAVNINKRTKFVSFELWNTSLPKGAISTKVDGTKKKKRVFMAMLGDVRVGQYFEETNNGWIE